MEQGSEFKTPAQAAPASGQGAPIAEQIRERRLAREYFAGRGDLGAVERISGQIAGLEGVSEAPKCAVTDRLSDFEVETLAMYITAHGRAWKAALRDDWMYARVPGCIQALRNASYFGPDGLVAVKTKALLSRRDAAIADAASRVGG